MSHGKRTKQAECVYCGKFKACNEEHVTPQCLWPKARKRPSRQEYVIIPVCPKCNNGKGRDDDYLRDLLIADIACEGNSVVEEVQQAFFRAAHTNRSDFARVAIRNMRSEPAFTPSGLYVGHFPTVPVDPKRVDRIFRLIARGLFWKLFARRIPENYVIEALKIPHNDAAREIQREINLGATGPYAIGNGVFYCYFLATGTPFVHNWLMCFYDRVVFAVTCMSPEMAKYFADRSARRRPA